MKIDIIVVDMLTTGALREADLIRVCQNKVSSPVIMLGWPPRKTRLGARRAGVDGVVVPADAFPVEESKEKGILECLEGQLKNDDIARELHMPLGTVKATLQQVFRRLNVSNRTDAVTVWKQTGWPPRQ